MLIKTKLSKHRFISLHLCKNQQAWGKNRNICNKKQHKLIFWSMVDKHCKIIPLNASNTIIILDTLLLFSGTRVYLLSKGRVTFFSVLNNCCKFLCISWCYFEKCSSIRKILGLILIVLHSFFNSLFPSENCSQEEIN